MASIISEMLATFRSDVESYQPSNPAYPAGLLRETGDLQASLENLRRLGTPGKLQVQSMAARKGLSRVLIQFSTGEQYLALGLNAKEAARIAAEAGMGPYDELLALYEDVAALPDYDDLLPKVTTANAAVEADYAAFERQQNQGSPGDE